MMFICQRIHQFLLFFLLLGHSGQAAIVNGYAQVTGIAGTTLTIGAAHEVASAFQAGDPLVIMQMQGNVIGGNTGNNASFGNLASIGPVGTYEVAGIASVSRSGATLLSITLVGTLSGAFQTGAAYSVQVITFKDLGGGGNYTTTADIEPLPWNGSIGGVVAINVSGALYLTHSINADRTGFKGGQAITPDPGWYYDNGPWGCQAGFVYPEDSLLYARKGHSIQKELHGFWRRGRGHLLNAGGGGNYHNAGGGGGGGMTAGGKGGPGWDQTAFLEEPIIPRPCSPEVGGHGGMAMGAYAHAGRVFMGGGGGAGEGNDGNAGSGGNGGGIILVKASALVLGGAPCAAVSISANGGQMPPAQYDGAGGGGGGGMIVLHVPMVTVPTGCTLSIKANGGNGADNQHTEVHGGGGGGGQGAVFMLDPHAPGVDVTTENGQGGCNNANGGDCGESAEGGEGEDGEGVIPEITGPLPVELLSFMAETRGADVHLTWATASERMNHRFEVQRSSDISTWITVGTVQGAGNSSSRIDYAFRDPAPLHGQSYYRLRQVDTDGTMNHSHVQPIWFSSVRPITVLLHPNPATDQVTVRTDRAVDGTVLVLNAMGQPVITGVAFRQGVGSIDMSRLARGSYTMVVQTPTDVIQARLMVAH